MSDLQLRSLKGDHAVAYEGFLKTRDQKILKSKDLTERLADLDQEIGELTTAVEANSHRAEDLLDQVASGTAKESLLEKLDSETAILQTKLGRKTAIRDRIKQDLSTLTIAPMKEGGHLYNAWVQTEAIHHFENGLKSDPPSSLEELQTIFAESFGIWRVSESEHGDLIEAILPIPDPEKWLPIQEKFIDLTHDLESRVFEGVNSNGHN